MMGNRNILRIMLALGLSSFLSVLLLAFRIFSSDSFSYIFLVWNLFLAWVPLGFAWLVSPTNLRWINALCLCAWLLFFPNAPYIVTDFIHLRARPGIPLWYDVVLNVSFAWNGLLLGFVSLFTVQKFLRRHLSAVLTWCAVGVLMVGCGFGIYLGRFERWNSWDLISNPLGIASDVLSGIAHPLSHSRMYGVTILFSIFLFLGYLTLFTLVNTRNDEQ